MLTTLAGVFKPVEPAARFLFVGVADDLQRRTIGSQLVGHDDMWRTKAMQQQRAIVCADG